MCKLHSPSTTPTRASLCISCRSPPSGRHHALGRRVLPPCACGADRWGRVGWGGHGPRHMWRMLTATRRSHPRRLLTPPRHASPPPYRTIHTCGLHGVGTLWEACVMHVERAWTITHTSHSVSAACSLHRPPRSPSHLHKRMTTASGQAAQLESFAARSAGPTRSLLLPPRPPPPPYQTRTPS